jgi:hypothetical protein
MSPLVLAVLRTADYLSGKTNQHSSFTVQTRKRSQSLIRTFLPLRRHAATHFYSQQAPRWRWMCGTTCHSSRCFLLDAASKHPLTKGTLGAGDQIWKYRRVGVVVEALGKEALEEPDQEQAVGVKSADQGRRVAARQGGEAGARDSEEGGSRSDLSGGFARGKAFGADEVTEVAGRIGKGGEVFGEEGEGKTGVSDGLVHRSAGVCAG